jgi:hypothetical protein
VESERSWSAGGRRRRGDVIVESNEEKRWKREKDDHDHDHDREFY